MPIYEYRCEACGHEFEKLQKLSDPVITECPECHQNDVKKLISAAGFRLKGGGWYETDFKKSGKRNLAGDSDAGSSGAGKSEAASKNKGGDSTSASTKTTKDKVA